MAWLTVLTHSDSCNKPAVLCPLLLQRNLPEPPEHLVKLGKIHLPKTKSDYSEFLGATCEKGSEWCFYQLSLFKPSSCVLLNAAPEADVAVIQSLSLHFSPRLLCWCHAQWGIPSGSSCVELLLLCICFSCSICTLLITRW